MDTALRTAIEQKSWSKAVKLRNIERGQQECKSQRNNGQLELISFVHYIRMDLEHNHKSVNQNFNNKSRLLMLQVCFVYTSFLKSS